MFPKQLAPTVRLFYFPGASIICFLLGQFLIEQTCMTRVHIEPECKDLIKHVDAS